MHVSVASSPTPPCCSGVNVSRSDVRTWSGSTEGGYIDWLTIADQTGSVVDDVRRIRSHPLVPSRIPVYGYVYDVRSGRLIEVPEATAVGRGS